MSYVDRYFANLIDILISAKNLSFDKQNEIWLSKFKEFEIHLKNRDLNYLPEIMPLIHPDFLYDSGGNFLGQLIYFQNNSFNNGINESDLCQIESIVNESSCQFNSFRELRGKCQADHLWPHSLGGPSIYDNRILLCRYHNIAKSNSIINAFWKTYPIWLNDYLYKIYNLKN
jgi:hypothetical protein